MKKKLLILSLTIALYSCENHEEQIWEQDACDTSGTHYTRPIYYYRGVPGYYYSPLNEIERINIAAGEESVSEHGGVQATAGEGVSARGGFGETGMGHSVGE